MYIDISKTDSWNMCGYYIVYKDMNIDADMGIDICTVPVVVRAPLWYNHSGKPGKPLKHQQSLAARGW